MEGVKLMKKLLAIILVLSMASAASAALQISVHTNPPGTETWDPLNPQETEITIGQSDNLILDVYTDSVITAGGLGDGEHFLMCDTSLATISGGAPDATLLGMGNVLNIYDTKAYAAWAIDDPFDGVGMFIGASYIPQGSTIFDEILFHCEGIPGDVVITLVSGQSIVPPEGDPYVEVLETWDSVIIHQTPEPMTLGLLGLGGLGLLRRRRS